MKTNHTSTNTIKPGNERRSEIRRAKSALVRNEILRRQTLAEATSGINPKTNRPHQNLRQIARNKIKIQKSTQG
jgi:hypothetical protein